MTLGPGSDYNRIENNRFEESRTNGIIIGNPSEPDQWNRFNTITGNMIHTNSAGNMRQYDAVVAYDAHNTIFSRNQVSSWYPPTTQHRSALVLGRGCDTWIVTGNIMRHNSAAAIIAAEDRATSSRQPGRYEALGRGVIPSGPSTSARRIRAPVEHCSRPPD